MKKLNVFPVFPPHRAAFRRAMFTAFCACAAFSALLFSFPETAGAASDSPIVLRVCNWEEYIDLGDWDEEETIDLESGDIIGVNPLIEDFEDWYFDTYNKVVKVEYSTFGTNEDLYNMLTLGDVYDVVCPSEYMFMKLMAEDALVPLSDQFFDTGIAENYYSRGVSPYIKNIFDTHEINGEAWSKYAAGYMWGITGIVYSADALTEEQVSSWKVLGDPSLKRRVTIKDNVRDSYFAAVGALKSDLLTSEEFRSLPDYSKRLEEEMNDVSPETIAQVKDYLQKLRDNVYSFETDSGKADMITGKVVANLQWSGDAVYTMDQAEEDEFDLCFAVPREATNIYFDGWVLLKSGIGTDTDKQHAAEAFINFCSRPDCVIRNMYYIGYTSVISGGDDERIFEYADWNFGAGEEDEEDGENGEDKESYGEDGEDGEDVEDTVEYSLAYFFSDNPEDEDYMLTVPVSQLTRQLFSQYPSEDTIARSSIMVYFDGETNDAINRMWIDVRCFNIRRVPVWAWVLIACAILGVLVWWYIKYKRRHRLY